MEGNFSRYATISVGAVVGLPVVGLIGRASMPFARTIRYGFCQSRASTTERYLLGSAGGMRFLSLDVLAPTVFCELIDGEQETRAIAAHKDIENKHLAMHRIVTPARLTLRCHHDSIEAKSWQTFKPAYRQGSP